ncbi:MAG: hypothetical protein ACSHX9_11780 [Luteolibacter sp.]
MTSHRHENFIPFALIVACGGTALGFIISRLGLSSFSHWFLYPSLFFFVFAIVGLFKPDGNTPGMWIWKACQWWSGVWLILFSLGFCGIPFTVGLWIFLAGISGIGIANPFLALFLHIVIWACATDIVKTRAPSIPADH